MDGSKEFAVQDRFAPLKALQRRHDFFVGLDSDGCVFDGMEIKHKECFCPAWIKHFGLQPISRRARSAWERVNLYSATRGTNRFKAIVLALDQLAAQGAAVPPMEGLRRWVQTETQLGTPALMRAVSETHDPDLAAVLAWNTEVNQRIEEMCVGVPPFEGAREAIALAAERADVMVVSQASADALEREWAEHGLIRHVRLLAGQEMGSKAEHLQYATAGKYDPGKVLMVGDALGDRDAALSNGVRFFPIVPGSEEQSWRRFSAEGLPRLLEGRFDANYQAALLGELAAVLKD